VKFGCAVSENVQTDRQTDNHAHHNTPLPTAGVCKLTVQIVVTSHSLQMKHTFEFQLRVLQFLIKFLPRDACTVVQSAVLRSHVVCLSVCDIGGS